MKLINISKNVSINPDHIVSVETKNGKLNVHLVNRTYVVEVPVNTFLNYLTEAGVDMGSQHFSV